MVTGMEATAKSLFADSVAAYEGLEIDLTPGPSPKMTGLLQKPSSLLLPHRRGNERK
jgi:hypothetical protein